MKDNWKKERLGKFLKLQGGYAFSSNSFQDNGVPLVRISNVTEKGITNNFAYLPENFLKKHSDFSLNENDILIAMSGATTGKNCQISSKNLPALLNQRTGRFIIVNEKELDNSFLSNVVKSVAFQTELLIDAVGGAQPNISSKQIENLLIDLPPLPQQHKIAKILTTCDAVIEKTEAAIAKYQSMKQGLMHDLFTRGIDVTTGKLRPKYEDAKHLYKESELGYIPKEWEVEILDSCIDKSTVITYGIVQTGEHVEGGIRVLRTVNLNQDGIDSSNLLRTTKTISDSYRRTYVKENDIVCNVRASVGDFNIITKELTDCNLTRGVARISLKVSINPKFVLGFLRTKINEKQMSLFIKGTTFIDINIADLRILKVFIPINKIEQDIIVDKINSIENKIQTEQSALSKYQQLKTGLMQDLLSGRVEVKV